MPTRIPLPDLETIIRKHSYCFTQAEVDSINVWKKKIVSLIEGRKPESERQKRFLSVMDGETPPLSDFEKTWSKLIKLINLSEAEFNLRERLRHFNQRSVELERELRASQAELMKRTEDQKIECQRISQEFSLLRSRIEANLTESKNEIAQLRQREKSLKSALKVLWEIVNKTDVRYAPQEDLEELYTESTVESTLKNPNQITAHDIDRILLLDQEKIPNLLFSIILERARVLNIPKKQQETIQEACEARGIPTNLPSSTSPPIDLLSECQACGRPIRHCQC